MGAVFSREMQAYFRASLGYAYLGVVFLFTGLYFFAYNLYAGMADLAQLFSVLFSVVLFLVPILTMRLLSEEKRQKTDQLLLTAPVTGAGIVAGKYFSALCVYAAGTAVTLLDALVLSAFAPVNWALALGNFLGLLLLGAALIAVCLFVSSLTESQLVAAVSSFTVSIALILMKSLEPMAGSELLRQLLGAVNFFTRYEPFTRGIVSLENTVFFLSVAALFTSLTTLRLERGRWA